MAKAAQPYLKPDEEIQAVFGAQTGSPYVAMLGGLLFFLFFLNLNRYRVVVATSERILVLDSGKLSQKKALSVVTELPRSTRLGPGKGIWHKIPVGNETLRVHRRFFKDILASDASVPAN